ncbi:poly(3-hydroxyalkanoate) depolymerase [Pseudonocardia aurantiaca]|uniref:Poly(3-hydroxyalkanoate) depolymerase n=1 Tax=Pseudonocardia aurantiaca TaxID=75290 RepID=A0ABW4FRS4_9PSEU
MDRVRMVTVGRQRLRVAVRPGTGSAPPLLLCNGIGLPLEVWTPFLEALDPALEVVRFDVPGVGGSPLGPLPHRFSTLARLAVRMLDVLGYERFDVLGVSWGGALAQQLAFHNPHQCRRVVLVATATGMLMVPASPHVLLKLVTPRRHRDSGYARAVAGEVYGGSVRDRPELVERMILAHDRPASGRGYLYQLATGWGWTSLPFLPLIRQPTLVLAGDDDPVIPLVNARVMAGLLPAAKLHVYHDGHLGILTRADELAAMVTRFLR